MTAPGQGLPSDPFGQFQYPTVPLAVYHTETIEAHRAFIARRRATRPSEEYRTPTDQEWDAFLAHFEKRKVSIGTCARAFGTPCIYEHAGVRCSLLRPDPAQRTRLEEIRDNLQARIIEANREGWLGEVEGLQVSLAGAEDKLSQLDAARGRQATAKLGIPTFRDIAGRTPESTTVAGTDVVGPLTRSYLAPPTLLATVRRITLRSRYLGLAVPSGPLARALSAGDQCASNLNVPHLRRAFAR